jgi:hypothetical protein
MNCHGSLRPTQQAFFALRATPLALLLIQGQALASTTLAAFPLNNNNADGNSGFNDFTIDSLRIHSVTARA